MACHTGAQIFCPIYPLEVNSKSRVSLRISTKVEKREETSIQFVAGKGLKIVAGIISTPELILLKNTIGRLPLPSEIFPGTGFQRVEFIPIFAFGQYSSHDAVEQWCLLFLVLCQLPPALKEIHHLSGSLRENSTIQINMNLRNVEISCLFVHPAQLHVDICGGTFHTAKWKARCKARSVFIIQ